MIYQPKPENVEASRSGGIIGGLLDGLLGGFGGLLEGLIPTDLMGNALQGLVGLGGLI